MKSGKEYGFSDKKFAMGPQKKNSKFLLECYISCKSYLWMVTKFPSLPDKFISLKSFF